MAYKPLFTITCTDPRYEIDNAVMKAVREVGIAVDKYELLKALEYDREQYQAGFSDGYEKALNDVERLMEKYNVTFYPMNELRKGEG